MNGGVKMTIRVVRSRFKTAAAGCAALLALAMPGGVYAQSCALCYQAAANSGANFIVALKRGILVMIFPPLLIGGAIAIAAYRKRFQYADE
jgi:hypothetical protein